MAKETCVEFWLVENRNRSVFLNRGIEPDEFCKSQGSAYRGACKHCAPTCTETVVLFLSNCFLLWTWLILPLRVIFLPLVSFVFSGCVLNTLVAFPNGNRAFFKSQGSALRGACKHSYTHAETIVFDYSVFCSSPPGSCALPMPG